MASAKDRELALEFRASGELKIWSSHCRDLERQVSRHEQKAFGSLNFLSFPKPYGECLQQHQQQGGGGRSGGFAYLKPGERARKGFKEVIVIKMLVRVKQASQLLFSFLKSPVIL